MEHYDNIMKQDVETIFVQIASYRDPECKHTIEDLYQKAERPENISVGVHWQYADDDNDVPVLDRSYRERVRVISTPYREAKGVCWARSITQTLYLGEKYTLQIDAHMRFVKHWDRMLLDLYSQLRRAGWDKPVITHYPPDYTLNGDFGGVVKKMVPIPMESGEMIRFNRSGHAIDPDHDELPVLQSTFAAGCFFADAACISEIPYDPNLYFFGEEISLAVRFWTNGWDLFNPGRIIFYHLYKKTIEKNSGKVQKNREAPGHWHDNEYWRQHNHRAISRVRHLLKIEYSHDPEVISDIERFGIGTERTLYQYERFSGLRFSDSHRRAYTRACLHFREQIPLGDKQERQQLYEAELLVQVDNMLLPSSSRILLNLASQYLRAKTMLDLGGFCVQSLMFTERIRYHAASVSDERVREVRLATRRRGDGPHFLINYVADPLPQLDFIACHHLLNYLPPAMIWQLLENFVTSGSRYLAIMRLPDGISLSDAPFHLPKPNIIVPANDSTHFYEVWHLPSIRAYVDGMPSDLALKRNLLIKFINQALDTLEKVMYDELPLLYRLLESIVDIIGTDRKKLLCDSRVVWRLQRGKGAAEQAKQAIIDLRFCNLSAAVSKACPFLRPSDSLFAMVVTCEHIDNYVRQQWSNTDRPSPMFD